MLALILVILAAKPTRYPNALKRVLKNGFFKVLKRDNLLHHTDFVDWIQTKTLEGEK